MTRSVHRQSPLTKINMESSTYCTRGCYFELVRTLNYTVYKSKFKPENPCLQAAKTRVFGFGKTRVGNPSLLYNSLYSVISKCSLFCLLKCVSVNVYHCYFRFQQPIRYLVSFKPGRAVCSRKLL